MLSMQVGVKYMHIMQSDTKNMNARFVIVSYFQNAITKEHIFLHALLAKSTARNNVDKLKKPVNIIPFWKRRILRHYLHAYAKYQLNGKNQGKI